MQGWAWGAEVVEGAVAQCLHRQQLLHLHSHVYASRPHGAQQHLIVAMLLWRRAWAPRVRRSCLPMMQALSARMRARLSGCVFLVLCVLRVVQSWGRGRAWMAVVMTREWTGRLIGAWVAWGRWRVWGLWEGVQWEK